MYPPGEQGAFHSKKTCISRKNKVQFTGKPPSNRKKEKKNGRIEHQIRFYFVTLQPIYAVEAQNK
jgi:hypothetical protein